MTTEKLRIAIQKTGRLHDGSMKLLQECGIEISNGTNQLRIVAGNFPAEIFFLRDDDIPEYVQDRVADIGIVGQNVVEEKNKEVDIIEKLEFGKCRLSVAVPMNGPLKSINDLHGKKIATSYPFILTSFLKDNKIDATIQEISGSVEIAPRIGLADAICDLVSSGSTLFSNELTELNVIMQSEAVLISNKNLSPEKQILLDKLLFRIRAVQKAKKNKYVLLNAPNGALDSIFKLLPGLKSPTVLPLAEPGWSSVHSVLEKDQLWEKIEQLKAAGGQGILVMPIEQMVV